MSTITQSQEQAALESVPAQLFIGGEWRAATGGWMRRRRAASA